MTSSVDDPPPAVASLIPAANALVRQLNRAEVLFSEEVTAVEAGDLLINGKLGTTVTAFNGSHYLFEFPQPANGMATLAWNAATGIHALAAAANPFAGGSWSDTLDPNAPLPGPIISEFMADNKKSLRDQDGDSSDWIEIYNAGSNTISLNGYYLTTQRQVNQWRFPNVTLLPTARGQAHLWTAVGF